MQMARSEERELESDKDVREYHNTNGYNRKNNNFNNNLNNYRNNANNNMQRWNNNINNNNNNYQHRNGNNRSNVNQGQNGNNFNRNNFSRNNNGNNNSNNYNNINISCYICSRSGHIASQCRSRPVQINRNNNLNNRPPKARFFNRTLNRQLAN